MVVVAVALLPRTRLTRGLLLPPQGQAIMKIITSTTSLNPDEGTDDATLRDLQTCVVVFAAVPCQRVLWGEEG